ncbi:hypothetical protein DPMN_041449 [Dreissena polymorpha]|uniref:Uncharacterized protein n=1 Tax=Dreissena polymorpha TaxID=45954 RepID=A0A9D4CZF3_DREPO|nr:hypothetical protein DPMN_041449 [Dreissena polymorpha]
MTAAEVSLEANPTHLETSRHCDFYVFNLPSGTSIYPDYPPSTSSSGSWVTLIPDDKMLRNAP